MEHHVPVGGGREKEVGRGEEGGREGGFIQLIT